MSAEPLEPPVDAGRERPGSPPRVGLAGDPGRTAIALQLQQLWKQVLRVDRIPPDADFFTLGADSIVAMELATEMEKLFGRAVSLPELLEATTLEGMARLIESRVRDQPIPLLVPLKREGHKNPLFVVHGLGGGVVQMRELARRLDADRPFHAFQARGLDGVTRPLYRIEAMAETYLERMRQVRPAGPYLVAGYSMGGVVAYEMARQLVAAGERVAALIVIDSAAPVPLPFRDRLSSTFVHGRIALRRLRRQLATRRDRQGRAHSLNRLMVANLAAVRRYRPPAYHGAIHVVSSRGGATTADVDGRDRELARRLEGLLVKQRDLWRRLALGGLEVHEIDGHHLELFRPPALEGLMAGLRAVLARVNDRAFA